MVKKILPQANSTLEGVKISLADCDGDLSKRWYVYEKHSNAKGIKHYIKNFPSADERYRRAKEIIKALKNGEEIEKSVIPDIIPKFREILREHSPRLRKSTVLAYRSHLDSLEKWMQKNDLDHLTDEQAQRYLLNLRRTLAPSTVRSYYTSLVWYFLRSPFKNPFKSYMKPKEKGTPFMYFTDEQRHLINNYLVANDMPLYRFCMFIYYCMIRPRQELRLLQVGDILLSEGKIRVPGEISKNKKTQYVIIPPGLAEILQEMHLEQYPANYLVFGAKGVPGLKLMPRNSMGNRFLLVLKKLGFDTKRYKMYSYKHSANVKGIKSNINPRALQMQNRHHSLDQFAAYIRSMGLDDLGESFAGLD